MPNGAADQPRRAGKPPAISPEVGASCAGWATIALICSLARGQPPLEFFAPTGQTPRRLWWRGRGFAQPLRTLPHRQAANARQRPTAGLGRVDYHRDHRSETGAWPWLKAATHSQGDPTSS